MEDEFRLTFPIPVHPEKWSFETPIIFMGSCFSDEMASKACQHGLNVLDNPFGTVFHPNSLANSILDALSDSENVASVPFQDLWFHWGSSGSVFGYNETDLIKNVLEKRSILKKAILESEFLYLTFGTAVSYEFEGETVANCHKQASTLFSRSLSEVDEMEKNWLEVISTVQQYNSGIQIIFTVSPVRHWREGIIENNRSKARLLLLVEKLVQRKGCSYFPSYELMLDDLRDYRFYTRDKAHPSEEAVSYIWKQLLNSHTDKEFRGVLEQTYQLKQRVQHRLLYPESAAARKFLAETDRLLNEWSLKYPLCNIH